MKLYELANEYNELLERIDAGEIPEEAIDDTLEAITGELEEKCESLACVIKQIEAEAEMLKAEEDRLRDRRVKKTLAAERIEEYLTTQMMRAHLTKIDRPRASVSLRKTTAVEVTDEQAFYEWAMENERGDLLNLKYSPAKTAIKQNLDEGFVVPYTTVVTTNYTSIK